MYDASLKLEEAMEKAAAISDNKEKATFYHEGVLAAMEALRAPVDKAEAMLGEKYLPYPTYGELLFSVNE